MLFQGENDFLQELQYKIQTLHANFLRVEEEKTKTAALHEQEQKEIKVNLVYLVLLMKEKIKAINFEFNVRNVKLDNRQ